MKEKVEEVIQKIRPALVADGGNVELVDVQDGIVSVRLTGACAAPADRNRQPGCAAPWHSAQISSPRRTRKKALRAIFGRP